jgi:hypothetical protein
MSPKFCKSCGASVWPSGKFCVKCGAAFGEGTPKKAETPDSLLQTGTAALRSAADLTTKVPDSFDGTTGTCQVCGEKMRRATKKSGTQMCYKCYTKVQQQQTQRFQHAAIQRAAMFHEQNVDQLLMDAHGVNGQLELFPTKIRIRRKGGLAFLTQGVKGDKDILIRQISSIQFRKSGHGLNGYLQFSFLGGQETKGGIRDATRDENTIMFSPRQQPAFETIKAAIEERMHQSREANTQAPPQTQSIDYAGQIQKLADLRAQQILTEEEFQSKKRELLSRM